MRILAIDTSTLTGSVALVEAGVVLAESASLVRASHSEALLPLVDGVLARAKCSLEQVDQLAVGIGPGSFTGVRIGVSVAKGLRLATGKALYGVRSLDAMTASAAPVFGGCVLALIDARRGELFFQLSDCSLDGSRTVLIEPMGDRPEAVIPRVESALQMRDCVVVGDLDEALWAKTLMASGSNLRRTPSVVGAPLARWIAWEALSNRGALDDGSMEPLYVRPTDARLPAQRL